MQHSIKTIAAAMVVLLLSANVSAQDAYTTTTAKTTYTSAPATETTKAATSSNDEVMANFPMVVSKFSTLFPEATSPQWSTANGNCWVSFLNDGRKARACFSQKGKMNYVLTDCSLAQLPAALREKITSAYPAYQLFNATEITASDAVAFQVILENSENFITLKYTGEDIEEVTQTNKTKE